MSTNHYFNNFPGDQITSEQLLVEDLVIETLKMFSQDCYYLPRESRDQIDYLMGEDALKSFPNAFLLEFYMKNVMGMEGEQDIISKFGLEIREEITLLTSRRRFRFTVPNLTRPREGDLIFIPMMKNFYEIIHVEHENDAAMYYTLGRGKDANVYLYVIKIRLFVFSEEQIQTGVEEIDDSIKDAYNSIQLTMAAGGFGQYDFVNSEIVYQGANLASATVFANAASWNTSTHVLEVIRVNGTFDTNIPVKGVTSGAAWTVSSINDDLANVFEDIADNNRIKNEANTILDWSETNPFGDP